MLQVLVGRMNAYMMWPTGRVSETQSILYVQVEGAWTCFFVNYPGMSNLVNISWKMKNNCFILLYSSS